MAHDPVRGRVVHRDRRWDIMRRAGEERRSRVVFAADYLQRRQFGFASRHAYCSGTGRRRSKAPGLVARHAQRDLFRDFCLAWCWGRLAFCGLRSLRNFRISIPIIGPRCADRGVFARRNRVVGDDALVVFVLALMLAGAHGCARKLLVEKLWGETVSPRTGCCFWPTGR